MASVGTLEHWIENREQYLSRADAAARIRKTDRTIRNYIAAGLTVYEPLPGVERIYLDELLGMWRSRMLAERGTRFRESGA